MILLWTMIGFICGSLMFSYWLAVLAKKNLRDVGDGNPGAFNLWKAAGYKYGLIGVILDFSKGYLPILLLIQLGLITDYQWVPVALAPIVGHAFSPFLSFQGGKGLAVSFGVWSALTNFKVSLAYAIILAISLLTIIFMKKGKLPTPEEDSLQTIIGMILLNIYLYINQYPTYFFWILWGNIILLIYKNREQLLVVYQQYYKEREKKENVFRL